MISVAGIADGYTQETWSLAILGMVGCAWDPWNARLLGADKLNGCQHAKRKGLFGCRPWETPHVNE